MNKMEIKNYGRGLALTMGLASMHVCVFCWNLLKDYVLKLMVSMCVSCWKLLKEYMLKLMDFNVCVFCWNLVTVDMLGLLQHVRCVFMLKCELSAVN